MFTAEDRRLRGFGITPKEIRILGIIDEAPFDPGTWSGISPYFFNSLKRKNCLYTALAARPNKCLQAVFKLLSFQPRLSSWRFKYHINVHYYRQMTRTALKAIESLDHHMYNVLLQIGAWYDLTRIPEKLTVSYHDGNLRARLKSPYGYPRVNKRVLAKALDYERSLYKRLDHIFVMSRCLAASFVDDFEVPRSKLSVVGAGINLPFIKESKDKNYDAPSILFVGNDFERKGGKYVLEAFQLVKKEIKDATLTIVGATLDDPPAGVRALGRISKQTNEGIERLLTEYASASVFVMPSLYEPFGIAFAEAMAHKLPCIGTNVCAIPEIIDDGVNGYLVPVRNSTLLARRLIDCLKDSGNSRQFGENAFRKYKENYTWDIVVDKIIQTISTLN